MPCRGMLGARRIGRASFVMVRCVLAWMTAVQPADADVHAPSTWWRAPIECPSADGIDKRIDALMPKDGVAPTVRIEITKVEAEFVATITIERADGSEVRTLRGPSCDEIAEAAALVIAIAARPAPDVPVDPRPPITDPPADEPRAPDPARGGASSRTTPARSALTGLRIGFGVDAGITWRTVPAVGPTIAGSIALIGPRWRVELRAVGTTPTRVRLPAPNDDVRAEVRSGLAILRGAFVPRVRAIEFPVHGGFALGAASAISRGSSRAQRRTGLLAALEAGAGIAWAPIPLVAVRLEVAAVLALARPRFGVHTPTADVIAFETPWLGLRALAGLELRFPAKRPRPTR